MSLEKYRPKRRSSDELPFGLYVALALLALWFVFAAWSFGGGAYTDYLLVVASGLIAITIAIPAALWRIWRSHPHEEHTPTFPEWARSEFHIWQDHVKGFNAAIEILLPVAAVAIGMSIFAVILHYTAH
jgi:hypothetical protein